MYEIFCLVLSGLVETFINFLMKAEPPFQSNPLHFISYKLDTIFYPVHCLTSLLGYICITPSLRPFIKQI